ncbi:uncharacterized protein N7459_003328 [Penicillium hispanicum]|uniref:uncharacterized protein n=1 Tax=Penicillium hispanicum TaxID=1080232 RepID=UPI0025415B9A|nr:uncharacterized protein N7459_003328 [Penicillium hispanicum]KAJ5587563.1 hypothetical protein N7459_003328 [Penicillium hispanicum]
MQPMPLLFRQSIRPSLRLTRTTANPGPLKFRTSPSALPVRPTSRAFSVCWQCQFRNQPGLYDAFNYKDQAKDGADADRVAKTAKEADSAEVIQLPGADAGSARAASVSATEVDQTTAEATRKAIEENLLEQLESESRKEQGANASDKQPGGLPSYLEGRRSKWSKQFSTMMDNIQSNVFVAGQRLNDLTGYSGIEALKNEIHAQETRLREARAQVRKAKEDYTAAINNRSTSQREVNELLQRKHAWSPTDLERFTLLYRNDHTNEVAEAETQEALSLAEREAEEAAAQLSRSILSRYHEEQVWSDKIRRMSTWGTWGLMGVNVLLFLIFQIAVEPWRRRRLVKGFEDKVVEALEKEKALNHAAVVEGTTSSTVPATTLPEVIDSTPESELRSTGSLTNEFVPAAIDAPTVSPSAATHPVTTSQSIFSRLVNVSSSPISLEYWGHALNELLSDRSIAISQRDLTMAAMQSAAAGAAVMGLVIALVRPR